MSSASSRRLRKWRRAMGLLADTSLMTTWLLVAPVLAAIADLKASRCGSRNSDTRRPLIWQLPDSWVGASVLASEFCTSSSPTNLMAATFWNAGIASMLFCRSPLVNASLRSPAYSFTCSISFSKFADIEVVVGASVGALVGAAVDAWVGASVGAFVVALVGASVGALVVALVGASVGALVVALVGVSGP